MAVGRDSDGVRARPRGRVRLRRPHHRDARARSRVHRPRRQRRRLRRLAQLRRQPPRRRPRRDRGPGLRRRGRLQAQELPPHRPGQRGPPVRAAQRVGRRPQPQLRRLLGRRGLERQRGGDQLPRERAVLGARVAGGPRPLVAPAPDRRRRQPHLHDQRGVAAPAGLRRRRGGHRGRGGDEAARRRDGGGERMGLAPRARDRGDHRGDRGLELLRAGLLRLHDRDQGPQLPRQLRRRRSSPSTSATPRTSGSGCARATCSRASARRRPRTTP